MEDRVRNIGMSNADAETGYPLARRVRVRSKDRRKRGEEQGCTTAAVRQAKATGSQSITDLRYDFANFPISCCSC